MKRLLLLLLYFFSLCVGYSQDETWFAPDRPGGGTGVGVSPFKKVLCETGFQCDWEDGTHVITLPALMMRVGVTSFAELRVEYDGTLRRGSSRWNYQVEPLILGTKLRVFEGTKWLPQTSFMANLAMPTSRFMADSARVAPSLYLLFSNPLTNWLAIDYNLGAEWNGVDAIPTTFVALNLDFSITDHVGAFVESYNYITCRGVKNTQVECRVDFGFVYVVTPRVQLDLYGNVNCSDPSNGSHIGFGFAWLLN